MLVLNIGIFIVNRTLTSALTATLVMLLGLSSPAYAVTPAGSLSLTVEVTHSGLEPGAESNKASVGITYSLIPTAPDLSAPASQQQEVNENETIDITYSYVVTSMANGPDQYLLSTEAGVLVNIPSAPSVKLKKDSPGGWEIGGGQTQEITLGATALSVDAQANLQEAAPELIVPSDGTADTAVNEIQAGDKVVIENTVYDVSGVVDDGVTGKITLGAPLAQDASVGTLIAEQLVFDMVLSGASVDDPTVQATIGVSVIAKTATGALGDTHETLTSVYRPIEAEFAIYVRNVSSPTVSSNVPYTSISGQEYFDTGVVQAGPGEILEYALVQTAGSGPALTDVEFKFNIPAFMTYETGSTILNNDDPEVDDDNNNSPLKAGMAVNSPGSAAGTIASFSFSEVTFSAKIVGDSTTIATAQDNNNSTACNSDNDCSEGAQCVAYSSKLREAFPQGISYPAGACADLPLLSSHYIAYDSGKVAWYQPNDYTQLGSNDNACWDTTLNDGAGGWVVGRGKYSERHSCKNQASQGTDINYSVVYLAWCTCYTSFDKP